MAKQKDSDTEIPLTIRAFTRFYFNNRDKWTPNLATKCEILWLRLMSLETPEARDYPINLKGAAEELAEFDNAYKEYLNNT